MENKFEIREGYDEECESFWYIHDNETGNDYGHYSSHENAETKKLVLKGEKNMKQETVKVLIKEPNKKAYIKEVKNELKTFQEIVGGYIETVGCPACLFDSVDLVVNEEGKLDKLSGNFFIPEYEDCIVGTAFAVGYTEDGDWCDVPEHCIEKITKYMNDYAVKETEDLYTDYENVKQRVYAIFEKGGK